MENPYQSPQEASPFAGSGRTTLGDVGWVRRIGLVAILMMVQGALEIVLGLFYGGMFVMMLSMAGGPAGAGGPQAAPFGGPGSGMAFGFFILLGGLTLVGGALKIFAGIRNARYRSRTLGIVALVSGVMDVFTCYCAPTGLALTVFGLIVYFNGDVARAFELGDQGMTPEAVRASFYE